MPYKRNLKIMQWNAQGVTTKPVIYQLQQFLNNENVDVLFLSETLLKENHKFYLNNFATYRNDRTEAGGGVAICIRNTIPHKLLKPSNTNRIENISFQIKLGNRQIELTSAYSPKYYPSFNNDIKQICPTNREFIVFGDLNARNTAWNCTTNNTAGNKLNQLQHEHNFFIFHPNTPTHYPDSGNTPSTIDLLLTNTPFDITQPIAHEAELPSDHCPITCTIDSDTQVKNPRQTLDFKSADWTKYQRILRDEINPIENDLNHLNTIEEIDQAIKKVIESINKARDESIPLKTHNSDFIKISNNTNELIKIRNIHRRRWQREQDIELKRILKTEINTLNKTINNKINSSINERWSKTLKNLKTGSKKFWRLTKTIRGKYSNQIRRLNVNDTTIITNKDKCEAIAEAFEKSHNITINQNSPVENEVNEFFDELQRNIEETPNEAMTSPDEILCIIKQLKNAKAPRLDGIQNTLIKQLPNSAIEALAKIFNACLKVCYFPKEFKKAKVIPIPKPGKDHSQPGNYRPISLLSSIGKIFERIIHTRISCFFEENNTIPAQQFGFRAQHSTTHQLLRVTKYIKAKKSIRNSTGMVLLDIEKAFDCVWHKGLLYKLHLFNLPYYLIKIIMSFISDREFIVFINGSASSVKKIPAGLPQGSVLSPLLYAAYTSDFKIPRSCEIAYYADDTAIYTSKKQSNTIIKILNNALVCINKYFSKWKIKMNGNKTQAIIFPFNKSYKRNPSLQLHQQNEQIPLKTEVNYLGVSLDSKLNFRTHIEKTKNKATTCMRALYPMLNRRSKLSHKNKNIIYKTVIRPVITYAAPVWLNAAKTNIQKLQIIQNKCLKIINNHPFYYSTSTLHQETKYEMITEILNKYSNNLRNKCQISQYELINELFN